MEEGYIRSLARPCRNMGRQDLMTCKVSQASPDVSLRDTTQVIVAYPAEKTKSE